MRRGCHLLANVAHAHLPDKEVGSMVDGTPGKEAHSHLHASPPFRRSHPPICGGGWRRRSQPPHDCARAQRGDSTATRSAASASKPDASTGSKRAGHAGVSIGGGGGTTACRPHTHPHVGGSLAQRVCNPGSGRGGGSGVPAGATAVWRWLTWPGWTRRSSSMPPRHPAHTVPSSAVLESYCQCSSMTVSARPFCSTAAQSVPP
jgi:hypothetical protein